MIGLLGTAMVLAAITIIGWPLLKGTSDGGRPESPEDTRLADLLLQKDAIFSALSELDSDYAMGNLSSKDYSELRQRYEQKGVSVVRDIDELQKGRKEEMEAEIEQQVLALRHKRVPVVPGVGLNCGNCGAEVDSGDNFCRQCGSAASLICSDCGAASEIEDRFCTECGARLGADDHV